MPAMDPHRFGNKSPVPTKTHMSHVLNLGGCGAADGVSARPVLVSACGWPSSWLVCGFVLYFASRVFCFLCVVLSSVPSLLPSLCFNL